MATKIQTINQTARKLERKLKRSRCRLFNQFTAIQSRLMYRKYRRRKYLQRTKVPTRLCWKTHKARIAKIWRVSEINSRISSGGNQSLMPKRRLCLLVLYKRHIILYLCFRNNFLTMMMMYGTERPLDMIMIVQSPSVTKPIPLTHTTWWHPRPNQTQTIFGKKS